MNENHDHRVSVLALSCREASRLLSESQDRALTRRERWALEIHTLLCGACRRFRAHLEFLRGAARNIPAEIRQQMLVGTVQLSPARREQIKRMLAKAAAAEK
jgi:hypothetical protein